MSLTFDSTWLNEKTVAPAKVRPLNIRHRFTRSDFARHPSAVPSSPEQISGGAMYNSTARMDAKLCVQTIGQRWADALRARYPTNTVKLIQADFDAAEGTVKAWLAGAPPQQRHVARAINLHGPTLAAEIYLPDSPRHRHERLMARLAAMEEALRAVRAEIGGGG